MQIKIHAVTASAILALASTLSIAQGARMERTALITTHSFNVRIIANGRDITDKSPVESVKYNADGSGTRTLRDGRTVMGQWQFINPEQTQIEVTGPEGKSRWVIIELSDKVYRKANLDTGVEFIHAPRLP